MTKDFDPSGLRGLSNVVLAEIVRSAMDAIITVDEQQRVVVFNTAAEKMFERAASELLGQSLAVLIPERFRVAHSEHVLAFGSANATRPNMGNLGAIYGLRADGKEFPIEAAISKTEVRGRKLFTVVLRDISERKRVVEALHASTRLVQSIVESSEDAIISKTLDGTIISWNCGAERLFGYSAQETLGKSMLILIPPERGTEEPEILARIGRGERVSHFETVRVCKDGRRIDVSVTVSPLQDSSGKIIGASKIARDITENKRAREKVIRLSQIHSVLSSINSLIVRSRDRQSLLDAACLMAVEQGGFGAAWIGLIDPNTGGLSATASSGPHSDRLSHDRESCLKGLVGRAIAEKTPAYSNDIASDPDESMTQRMRVSLDCGYRSLIALPLVVQGVAIGAFELFAKERGCIDESELRLLTEIAGDVSFALEHIAQEERLHYLAYHDPLTGLANRTLLSDRLEQAIRGAKHNGKQIALLFGDVKGFRQINESFGRDAGDAILRELAGRLRQLSPEPENVARISADYYAGIISNFKAISDLGHLVENSINGLLSAPYSIGNKRMHVSTRAGIAVFPNDGDTADVLLRNAEAAHKKCKSSGDRYLFYQPEMNAKVAETLLLESKLRTALEQHQFILHYQPKITAEDGRISGIEALIRWNDPDNGLVLPAKFIPVLEETGMILEVGQWVIRQALAHHSLWMAEGLEPPRIAVNVSAAQVRQKDFVNMVRRALGGITSDALEFEITESVVMHDIEDIIKKLQSLRDMGINISIDDFGTGYSSLTYLARLPINTVKIDRSFVANMTTDANSMTMVSAILSLAHSLKLRVVAEGVETEDQARLLRLLRCDEWQGHLFGKPVSQKEIVHFFIPPKANNATRLDTNAAKLNSTAAVSNPITKTRG